MNYHNKYITHEYLSRLKRSIILYLLDFDYNLRQDYTQDHVARWYGGHYSEEFMPEESLALEVEGYFSQNEIFYIKKISNLLHKAAEINRNNLTIGVIESPVNLNYNANMDINIYEEVKTTIDEFLNIESIKDFINKMKLINSNGRWLPTDNL
ncbi:hypothetical protein BWI97_17520 [Siphonobacter sp. BAB-5405]|uniref:hypothetical protein n=1 Tax=Siphonobacter sp. BAB-5405 TaxID=1864825 RepID=UPI000C80FC66|nr:hypothetical protein [Siphonobacter sp. BAB-5405]PMD93742.1 hypothetical protein BWI97_17520 [Siphonobacter sp. BAB-5405]